MKREMSYSNGAFAAAAIALGIASAALGWLGKSRELRLDPPVASDLDGFRLMPNGISGTPPESYFALGKAYETDAYNLGQGKVFMPGSAAQLAIVMVAAARARPSRTAGGSTHPRSLPSLRPSATAGRMACPRFATGWRPSRYGSSRAMFRRSAPTSPRVRRPVATMTKSRTRKNPLRPGAGEGPS